MHDLLQVSLVHCSSFDFPQQTLIFHLTATWTLSTGPMGQLLHDQYRSSFLFLLATNHTIFQLCHHSSDLSEYFPTFQGNRWRSAITLWFYSLKPVPRQSPRPKNTVNWLFHRQFSTRERCFRLGSSIETGSVFVRAPPPDQTRLAPYLLHKLNLY